VANPESKQLAIDVIARVDRLEKSMAKARKATNDNFRQMETRGQRFQAKMNDIGRTAFAGFAAGAAAALAPMAAFQRAVSEIDRAAGLVRLADRIGLSTDALQQLRIVAEQAGIPLESMDDAMQEFGNRVGEAINGAGPLADIFKANGIELRNADGSAKSLVETLRIYADLIKNAGSEAEALFLTMEAFGDSAAPLANVLRQGASAIDSMAEAAARAGDVVDEELLRKSEELDKQLDALWRNFETNSTTAILAASAAISGLIEQANQFGNSSFFQWLSGKLGTGDAVFVPGEGVFNPGSDEMTASARVAQAFQGAVQTADAELVEALRKRYGTATQEAARTVIPGNSSSTGASGGSGRSAAIDAANREAEAVLRVIERLQEEQALIGATDVERAQANALRQAGAAATAEQRAQIEQLVAAIYAEREATEKAAEAAAEMRDIGREAMGGFIDDMLAGKDAADALADALSNIGNRLLNSGLDALFGGLFPSGGASTFVPNWSGGLWSEGGYTGAGGKHQPAGIVHKGEYVFSKDAVSRIGVGNLERLHRGYANGGLVGAPSAPKIPAIPSLAAKAPATTNLNISVDVTGARGNQEILEMVNQGVSQGIRQFANSRDFQSRAWQMADMRVNDPRRRV